MRNCFFALCAFALSLVVCFANEDDIRYDNKPCTGIDEELLRSHYNMAPVEHPWIARLVFKDGGPGTTSEFRSNKESNRNRNCLGALITERHILAPAACIRHHYFKKEAVSVELGVWNRSSEIVDEWNCDGEGYCVPPVEKHILSDIAVHPEYDSVTSNNNIALLTLSTPVEISDFVQPVCQRPESLANESNVGQYFYVGGFHTQSNIKNKSPMLIITDSQCKRVNPTGITVFTSSVFCAIPDFSETYDMGSPLVGVNVVNDEPSGFFLVGFTNEVGMDRNDVIYSSFQDVRPFKSWIQRNIGVINV